MSEKIQLTKKDRFSVAFRHQFLQGSWNYERMQNGGWCYSMIPAIKRLYPRKEDQIAALKRHMAFYNTHPYVSAPVAGVTLALEEDRANGAKIDDEAIQGVKVGMMGPLAGIGDPAFWFTLRPILGAMGASLALSGSIMAQSCSLLHGTSFVLRLSGIRRNLVTRLVRRSQRTYREDYLERSRRERPYLVCLLSADWFSVG